jgi:hypothetical protein
VLLDATIVRGIGLPAAVALLGERGWKVRGPKPPSGPQLDEGSVDLIEELEALAARAPMPVSVDVLVDGPRPTAAASRAMLAVAEQALAQAGTRAHVRLCVDGDALTVQVTDRGPRGDGQNADEHAPSLPARPPSGELVPLSGIKSPLGRVGGQSWARTVIAPSGLAATVSVPPARSSWRRTAANGSCAGRGRSGR